MPEIQLKASTSGSKPLNDDELDDLITIDEAAEFCGYQRRTIKRLCERNIIKALLMDDEWAIDRKAFLEFVRLGGQGRKPKASNGPKRALIVQSVLAEAACARFRIEHFDRTPNLLLAISGFNAKRHRALVWEPRDLRECRDVATWQKINASECKVYVVGEMARLPAEMRRLGFIPIVGRIHSFDFFDEHRG